MSPPPRAFRPAQRTPSWTAAVPMTRNAGPMFEYAGHEGNVGLENILPGARAQERRESVP